MSGLADTDVNASKPSTASAHEPHCAPHALPAKPRSSARESAAADGSAKPSRIAIADALRSSHASQQVWSGLVWSDRAVALWRCGHCQQGGAVACALRRTNARVQRWWLTARRVLTAACTQPHWSFHEGIGFGLLLCRWHVQSGQLSSAALAAMGPTGQC